MAINEKTINNYIMIALLATVLFKIVADLFPEMQSAGDSLNSSGMPLGSFFTSGGVVWLIFGAGLVLLAYRTFMSGKHK